MSDVKHSQFWPILICFWSITHHFGFLKRFPLSLNPKVRLRVGHQHWPFWPILGRFMDYYSLFWGPKAICMVVGPKARLRVSHQQSQFCPILARFMDYYSPFWGPRAISSTYDPRDAFACLSSTLTVLANSDPLRGLLLSISGSQSDFHD